MSKIILTTGFAAVSSSLNRPSTVAKGIKLVEANHVAKLEEHREPGKATIISGRVVRQTSVTSVAYAVSLELDEDRNVTDGRCSCIGGIAGECKHVAAIIYAINHERDESQTDQQCAWKKPSEKGKALYPKGLPLQTIIRKRHHLPRPNFEPPSKEAREEHLKLLEDVGDTNSMMYRLLTAQVCEDILLMNGCRA